MGLCPHHCADYVDTLAVGKTTIFGQFRARAPIRLGLVVFPRVTTDLCCPASSSPAQTPLNELNYFTKNPERSARMQSWSSAIKDFQDKLEGMPEEDKMRLPGERLGWCLVTRVSLSFPALKPRPDLVCCWTRGVSIGGIRNGTVGSSCRSRAVSALSRLTGSYEVTLPSCCSASIGVVANRWAGNVGSLHRLY